MTFPWGPVVVVDVAGSVLMVPLSFWCAKIARELTKKRPDDVFRNYIFLFTLAIVFFSISRSFGHLIKQILLLHGMDAIWAHLSPYSGAVNSTAFVVIFAFGISFHRFQRVHTEIEYYKSNLEDLITERTKELEQSRNTLQNILDNSNPINITSVNFDLVQANNAYYSLWPRKTGNDGKEIKCYESRPGAHCHTDSCPLTLIINGQNEVIQEVSKELDGVTKEFILTARAFRDLDGKLIGMVESFLDITKRKQAEKAMRESEERFRKVFQSNPDPVILATLEDGIIIDVNKAFESATGIRRSTALGRNSRDLELWVDQDARESFMVMIQQQGEINNYEAEFRIHDGRIKTGLVSASLLRVNKELCMLLVIRDITKEKDAERALLEMDKMKSEFISTAAHELSTPLSSIMGFAEFLRTPGDFGGFSKDQESDFINEIYENGEALTRIIEDLLDISRIESGKQIPLVLQEADICALLRKKAKTFTAHNMKHPLHLDLPDRCDRTMILLDYQRINQVLDNLLSNAAKYSPEGAEINIIGQENKSGWSVTVADQGVGMTSEQTSHIFDKFYRADASNTAISGLGLGMSIVQQVIMAHCGEINVESSVGKGTRVTFYIPFATGEQTTQVFV